jgi:hypothetical protein
MPRNTRGINWAGVLGRIAAAAVLVFATFNPFGRSWFHWVILPMIQEKRLFLDPFKVLAGILLAALWVFFLRASQRSIGTLGAFFTFAAFAVLMWMLSYLGVFTPTSSKSIAVLTLIAITLVLGIGASWSLIRQRVTGQVEVD